MKDINFTAYPTTHWDYEDADEESSGRDINHLDTASVAPQTTQRRRRRTP